jgi:hypothetical protein
VRILSLGALGLMAGFCTNLLAESISFGKPELLYHNDQFPPTQDIASSRLVIDATFGTLKKDAKTLYFFQSAANGLRKYTGSLGAPFGTPAKLTWEKSRSEVWPGNGNLSDTGKIYAFIANIYKIDSNSLLGFVHIEDCSQCKNVAKGDCGIMPNCRVDPWLDHTFHNRSVDMWQFDESYRYRIGLAISKDRGDTWNYLKDILANGDAHGFTPESNIGGVPYLTVGEYFYVYFNQRVGPVNTKRISVARAKISEVVNAALSNCEKPKVCPEWKKYNALTKQFDLDGLTGEGSNIITVLHPRFPDLQHYDTHQDATFAKTINKYLLLLGVQGPGEPTGLLMYSSTDGINWNTPRIVEAEPELSFRQPYGTFMTLNNASDDGHIVGSSFYILYPRISYANWVNQSLYRRKVSVLP